MGSFLDNGSENGFVHSNETGLSCLVIMKRNKEFIKRELDVMYTELTFVMAAEFGI